MAKNIELMEAKRNPGILSFVFIIFIGCIIIFDAYIALAGDSIQTEAIVDSAEKFFISLKKGDYKTAWELLSEESTETIINDIHKISKKMGEEIKKEDITKDFNSNGEMFNSYWDNYLENFDPDMALEQSTWKLGSVKEDKAEILLLYEKSQNPARLKMFKQDGAWKVGLVETFWKRKYW
ncbi:MAG: hypothetical protein V3R54_07560 [Thermodesulfovibrionia bacterium]